MSIYPIVDTQGNWALVLAPGIGPGAGLGAAGGVTVQGTNAQNLDALLPQTTHYVGGSWASGPAGGMDVIIAEKIMGLGFFGGIGAETPIPVPIEFHWIMSPSVTVFRGKYDFWNPTGR